MLVLTRKAGEQIIIQGNIRISVVSVGPGRVKIGIDAPADVKIDRQEIHERKADDAESLPVLPMPVMQAPATAAVTPMPAAPKPTEVAAPAGLHNRISGRMGSTPGLSGYRRKAR